MTDTDKVIAAMAGQTFKAPDGFTSTMDAKNHHLHKPVFIGEVKADGQFNVVWKTPGPIKAQPWSPFIPGNERRRTSPDAMSKANEVAGRAAARARLRGRACFASRSHASRFARSVSCLLSRSRRARPRAHAARRAPSRAATATRAIEALDRARRRAATRALPRARRRWRDGRACKIAGEQGAASSTASKAIDAVDRRGRRRCPQRRRGRHHQQPHARASSTPRSPRCGCSRPTSQRRGWPPPRRCHGDADDVALPLIEKALAKPRPIPDIKRAR